VTDWLSRLCLAVPGRTGARRLGLVLAWSSGLTQTPSRGLGAERLPVGSAALALLQVLVQAKRMGRERISSREISEYTTINVSQIRRDLSPFGSFGRSAAGCATPTGSSPRRRADLFVWVRKLGLACKFTDSPTRAEFVHPTGFRSTCDERLPARANHGD
jgi:hypothetical protein